MSQAELKRFEELLSKHGTEECTPEVLGELIGLSIRIIGMKLLGDLSDLEKRLDALDRRIEALEAEGR